MKIRIFDKEELDLVQFHMLQEGESFETFSDAAKYIESSVFSVFKYCFELSNPDFEYAKVNIFDKNQLVSLRHNLLTHLTRLNSIDNAHGLELLSLKNLNGIEFMNALKMMNADWQLSWEKIRDKLVAINRELIEMTDICIDDDKQLCIRGF